MTSLRQEIITGMNNTQQSPPVQFTQLNYASLVDAALAYASLGFKVFPLQPYSKLPLPGWSWKRTATTDHEVIRSWWAMNPSYNIGIATGEVSGIDALDIDMKHGQDGQRSYQAIAQDQYSGSVHRTPSGGSHLLFAHQPGFTNFTRRGDWGGLDMRTTGGYILGAPSVVDGAAYYWENDGLIPAMPPALTATCHQWSTQSDTQTVDAPEVPEDLPDINTLNLDSKYTNYLNAGVLDPWEGDESRALFAVAGALMRKLQDQSLVFGVMVGNPFAWACAERHRQFGDPAGWLWKYGIAKIVNQAQVKTAADVFSPLPMQVGPVPIVQEGEVAPAAEFKPFFISASEGSKRAQLAPQWIIRGLIEKGQVGLVYGDSQALKSYMCLDMAVQVVVGGSWHGHDVVDPGPVWFLAGEGNTILWRRLEALRQKRAIHSDKLKDLFLSSGGLNLMDVKHLEFLRSMPEHLGGPPRLLIVDTLSRNALLDENSARDVGEFINTCAHIAAEWGCTVLVVHHAGKGNKGTARGSSALEANTDFRFQMERQEGLFAIRTKMTVQKLKGAPEPKEPIVFDAETVMVAGVFDDDFAPVTDLVFRRVEPDVLREHIKTQVERGQLGTEGHKIILAATDVICRNRTVSNPDAGCSREEIWHLYRAEGAAAGKEPTRSNFARAMKRLVDKQWLLLEHTDRDEVWYNLPKND